MVMGRSSKSEGCEFEYLLHDGISHGDACKALLFALGEMDARGMQVRSTQVLDLEKNFI